MFLGLYCPIISEFVKGYNYRKLLDLIFKLVVDYQDASLIPRKFKPGNNCEWSDDAKFAQAQLQEYYFNDLNYALKLYEDIMLNHKDSFYLAEARKRYRELNLNSE